MFKMSKFNMDKFIHTFIQNLGLRIESCTCKKFNKIAFMTNIDKSYTLKQLYPAEEIKEVNVQQDLDFSTEKNIKYFMEKHANLFDKLTYLNNTQILNSHLKNINSKILQKIKTKRKYNGIIKKGELKTHNKTIIFNKKLKTNFANKLNGPKYNLSSSITWKQKYINSHCKKNKFKKAAIFENSKLICYNANIHDYKNENTSMNNDEQKIFSKHNLTNVMINFTKKEIEMTEKLLLLYIKDVEYIKRNIQVTLHITKVIQYKYIFYFNLKCFSNYFNLLFIIQNSKFNYDTKDRIEYNQLLCHHAILCLIEPSKKGAVLIEDNLPVIIKKYLMHGYKYHFDFQRYFI